MERVEDGVSNFRAFQLENREFMGWFRAEQENKARVDKRRSKIHFALLSLLSLLIVALFSFLLTHYDNKRSALVPFYSQSQPQDATATQMHY